MNEFEFLDKDINPAKVNRNFNFLSLLINPHKSPYKSGIYKVRKSKITYDYYPPD